MDIWLKVFSNLILTYDKNKSLIVTTMDKTDVLISWFAGFYEGEGSISNDIQNRNRLKISITQNDKTPLEIGKKIWGGTIRKRVRKSPASEKICTTHEWGLSHNHSLDFIKDIRPYMLIPYKIGQIDKCMETLKKPWTKRFNCSFCDNTFSDPSGRRRHEKTQHLNKDSSFECTVVGCKRKYKTRDSMTRHLKTHKK
jgi:hypothetical protein